MRNVGATIVRNLASPIVVAVLVLSVVLLIFGDERDAWFISVVIVVNTAIAIIQEIRAQLALKKLELMNQPLAHVEQPNGLTSDVSFKDLNVHDIVQLRLGDEVPADGEIIESYGLEIDESLMSGESKPLEKNMGATAYAGSSVVAGGARMKVTAIANDTKAGQMTSHLRQYKPVLTPVQRNIARAITWLTYGALILAMLIFIVYNLSDREEIQILRTITSGAITVVPEGLLLGSTLLLAYGALRLAKVKVLPQKISAIESMALLDILCVDKTGTLTADKVVFEEYIPIGRQDKNIDDMLAIMSRSGGSNATSGAIAKVYTQPKQHKIIETLAFSSERKISGIKAKIGSKTYSMVMGAPEYIAKIAKVDKQVMDDAEKLAAVGKRILLVAAIDKTSIPLKSLKPTSARVVGLIVLSNQLRRGVKKTIAYLQKNKVNLRVISGDNPKTVSYIAARSGINNSDRVITGDELSKTSDEDWDETVSKNTVFARILPDQKEKLVSTFRRLGFYTGMVGDGVNDALAIKKADLGVAMYEGAAATRRVADIVLLDSSFTSLPIGMRLGNRIIQAIEIISTLFFHKIIFGVFLLATTLALGLVYPFSPRHVTFMNIFLVTMPTIIWTIFTPVPRRRVDARHYWRDTLFAVAPIAVMSGLAVAISFVLLSALYPYNTQGVATTAVMIAILMGVYMVYLVPRMFDIKNTKKSRLALALYSLGVLVMVLPAFRLSLIQNFFDFSRPAWGGSWLLILIITSIMIMQWIIAGHAGNRIQKR